MNYSQFLESKKLTNKAVGMKPTFVPDYLKDFQRYLLDWSLWQGRSAIFSDCGTGKGIMELVWLLNILKPNRKGLIVAPLAVSRQFVREGQKFDIKVNNTQNGVLVPGINVTNYERLDRFSPNDIDCISIDESSILKGHDRKYRKFITQFMSKIPYRLLATATPAPNDHMELGTSSEALGMMGRNQMLGMFFTNDGETTQQWRLKGHARTRFWQWVSTWARSLRKPSDLGFDDTGYILPELITHQYVLPSDNANGFFVNIAKTLADQRKERITTLEKRCDKVRSLIKKDRQSIVWCHLNPEGDLLEKIIPDAVQVAGRHDDEVKEDRLIAFAEGKIKVLVCKPKIGGFGLNLQNCSEVFYFPSHSHESYYQAIRRCWRFGQTRPVNCHIVTTEGERMVLDNMLRKERQSIELYDGIVRAMGQAMKEKEQENYIDMELPQWA